MRGPEELQQFLSSPLAMKRDIAVTILLGGMCVGMCVRASARICLGHNSCIYALISKLFDISVFLEEENYHFKHFR